MNNYFLIVRSRKNNSFTVLKLREDWYLGKNNGRQDVFSRSNYLEAIDLVTTRFGSESEMAERMAMNGFIPDSDVDIFIASKREKNGKSYIKFDEVIYKTGPADRVAALRRVAKNSLVGDFKADSYALDLIYDDVISLTYMSNDYLEMLLEGVTNVPCQFAEQLRAVRRCGDIPLDLKTRGDFGADKYSTVRNIVESMQRLVSLNCSSREDMFVANDNFIEQNLSGRLVIAPELSMQFDDDYIEGQLSIFSLLVDDSANAVAATPAVAEEKIISTEINVDRTLSPEAKRKEIYRVLNSIPRGALCGIPGTNKYAVNYDLFAHYPPSEDEAKKLNTYLAGNLFRHVTEYVRDYRLLCDANNDGFTPPSEIAELQTTVEYDVRRIDSRFKSSKCLNMAYEWCMVLEGAIKRDKAVSEGAKVSTDTDDKAKTYGKKQ